MTQENNDYGCLDILIGLAITPFVMLYQALIITQFWSWFIEDFFDQKPLTYKIALGISATIAALTYKLDTSTQQKSTMVERALAVFFGLGILHFVGWMYYLLF